MATKLIFNANTQKKEPAELTVDNNGEIVATFEDNSFIKFPASKITAEIENLIDKHEEANTLPEEQAKIEEARKEAESIIEDITD